MKHISYIIPLMFLFAGISAGNAYAGSSDPDITAKHVRTYIKNGNEAYKAKDYAKAETYYLEAYQEDKNSSAALFNLALTMLRKNGNPLKSASSASENGENQNEMTDPVALFSSVISLNNNDQLVTSSYYNMGNIYFEAEKYAESIEHYKNVLRRDPDNMKARQNLRIAQLKLEEQQKNNQQNKDNQDQNKDNNQNQNQDQQNQQQDKQNNENKSDENKQQDKSNQDKQQNKDSQNNQDRNNQPQNKNQGSSSAARPAISKENSDKILESARKQEEQTRKKVEKRRGEQTTRRTTDRPW